MARDLSLSRETEQFSFIHTLTIYPHQENEAQNQLASLQKSDFDSDESKEISSSPQKGNFSEDKLDSDRKSSRSSALCTRAKIASTALSTNSTTNNPLTVSNYWYSLHTFNNNNLATVIVLPELEQDNQENKTGFSYYLDRIFVVVAAGYLCFVLWWLFGTKNAIFPLNFLSQPETISQADAEFIDYMQQSLEVIERKVTQQKSSVQNVVSSDKKNAEVVYVPVYTTTPSNTSNQRFSLPQPPTLLPPPPPPNQVTAINPSVSAVPIKSPAPPSESVEVKTTPNLSSPDHQATKSTPQTVAPHEIAAAKITAKTDHTLVGVMELKEGSAALFKINGVTQRIWLGEKIENTGWVLQAVTNQKVQISRQGKSLTLSVGETF